MAREARYSARPFAQATDQLGVVAQLVRALPCHGRGCGFESRRFRQVVQKLLPKSMVRKTTAFEQKVYNAINRIPQGRVSTYALIGKAIGCKSAQAVGQALKRNPFAPEVPCHRVITSTLTIGGYSGATSGEKIKRKLKLLASEGVRFENGSLSNHALVFNFNGKQR